MGYFITSQTIFTYNVIYVLFDNNSVEVKLWMRVSYRDNNKPYVGEDHRRPETAISKIKEKGGIRNQQRVQDN